MTGDPLSKVLFEMWESLEVTYSPLKYGGRVGWYGFFRTSGK